MNEKYWENKRWTFNGREVVVVNPGKQWLSVVCVPTHPDIAEYLVSLQDKKLGAPNPAEGTDTHYGT